ncbi:hypothetical protein GGTG_09998 [Gaeumannomyces tritici R3-111a-1]|uniref:Uncharacterized protein n=1 Tax=Gaeumannomyces tritici (strain R3-111a-1) TaxID=644352 RepID=J3P914_GAET3|nr:hypothetical protein GGTG_09998 [Gaeumannomyces tritici R3-111a-1]EJT73149.1 hypothetical protein GGTG_09998 [Gaeumannomyces tritici R3-111a-1]
MVSSRAYQEGATICLRKGQAHTAATPFLAAHKAVAWEPSLCGQLLHGGSASSSCATRRDGPRCSSIQAGLRVWSQALSELYPHWASLLASATLVGPRSGRSSKIPVIDTLLAQPCRDMAMPRKLGIHHDLRLEKGLIAWGDIVKLPFSTSGWNNHGGFRRPVVLTFGEARGEGRSAF